MKSIPFKNRLVVRLAVGMIGVALLSLFIMAMIQIITFTLSDIQPPQLRERVERILRENPDDPVMRDLLATPARVRTLLERSTIISILVSLVLWIIFAIRFARSIATPIEHVTLASAQITNGDLATRVNWGTGSRR